jgi:hypothetical protein
LLNLRSQPTYCMVERRDLRDGRQRITFARTQFSSSELT